ncbi:MAG TPA: flavin reductase family protein [Acidimicrobiia bacterium]|nr:flavin reductase family protein [Acidimicrobiia bacterium]
MSSAEPEAAEVPPIDSGEFRRVLGHFATGVTIITGMQGDQPVGMAANSFTSVSLDPPFVLVCMARTSETWPLIQGSGAFAVNMLAEGQEDVCRRFSAKGTDRFAGTGWEPAATGSPILRDSLAYVDCTIEVEHEAGDHVIVLGRVVDMGRLVDGRPLVFWRGGYGRLGD